MQHIHDDALFCLTQIRMHRQTNDLLRGFITLWQLHVGISHGGLFVQRNRVVHGGGDAGGFEFFLHLFAVLHADGVLGVDAGVVGGYVGEGDCCGVNRDGGVAPTEEGCVAGGYLLA